MSYNLAFCAIFWDEAKILLEWLAYHRSVGVDHFFLYNHESQGDDTFFIGEKVDSFENIPAGLETLNHSFWQGTPKSEKCLTITTSFPSLAPQQSYRCYRVHGQTGNLAKQRGKDLPVESSVS